MAFPGINGRISGGAESRDLREVERAGEVMAGGDEVHAEAAGGEGSGGALRQAQGLARHELQAAF